MAAHSTSRAMKTGSRERLSRAQWVKIGLIAGLAAILPVLIVQALALAVWPEAAAFKPLDNYARTAVFTLVPALIATALFARLARSSQDPAVAFIRIAAIVLLVSFIPDYLLPDPNKTVLASSIAAFLHIIAAVAITTGIITGYGRAMKKF